MQASAIKEPRLKVETGSFATELNWFSEMSRQWESGHRTFGLVFNTADYVMPENDLPRPLISHLCQQFEEKEYLVVTFSISGGLEIYERNADKETLLQRYSGMSLDQQAAAEPRSGVLQGLGKLLMQNTVRVLVILNYAQHLVPAVPAGMASVASDDQISCLEQLNDWGLDNYLKTKTQNAVIAILREGHFHEVLSEHWKIIRVGMPTVTEMERFYTFLSNKAAAGEPFAALEPGVTASEAARASVGLRLRTIEGISRRAHAEDETVSLMAIKSEKGEEIRRLCGDVLEVLGTNRGFDEIAGLEHVKHLCRRVREQVKLGRRHVPLAILLAGPPGNGKSYLIRAFAHELNWNCLMLRTVRSMWVGESERNLERVLNAIDSNLPALLFIDEVDQMLGQRSQGGDSGTSERMLARLWEYMSENQRRGRLIFAAATNRPDLLDPATVDRFQYVIPVLQPTADEFRSILPNCAAQLDCSLPNSDEISSIPDVMQAKGLSIRQTLDILAMAALKSDPSDAGQVTHVGAAALIETVNNFRSNHDPFEMEAITLEAIRMTTFSELLPWHGSEGTYRFPRFITALLDENSQMNAEALHKRLSDIRRQRLAARMMG